MIIIVVCPKCQQEITTNRRRIARQIKQNGCAFCQEGE
jgi:predicted amino acid-binding ACT domain protein